MLSWLLGPVYHITYIIIWGMYKLSLSTMVLSYHDGKADIEWEQDGLWPVELNIRQNYGIPVKHEI